MTINSELIVGYIYKNISLLYFHFLQSLYNAILLLGNQKIGKKERKDVYQALPLV